MYKIDYRDKSFASIYFEDEATIQDLIQALQQIEKRYGNLPIVESYDGMECIPKMYVMGNEFITFTS